MQSYNPLKGTFHHHEVEDETHYGMTNTALGTEFPLGSVDTSEASFFFYYNFQALQIRLLIYQGTEMIAKG